MLSAYTDLRPGDVVAVRDQRLARWRRATVIAVNPYLHIFTARAGNIWFCEVIHPLFVRRVRIVYSRPCGEMRRAA